MLIRHNVIDEHFSMTNAPALMQRQQHEQARLRSIGAHLGLGRAGLQPAAAAPFVGNDSQGLGIRAAAQPPVFNPNSQHSEAYEFWQEHGFVVVAALSEQEVAAMNAAVSNKLPPS